jgi:XTP/dITP diphosphohydrolase
MKDLLTLVIASSNPGKAAEIRDLLADSPICIKNLDDFGPIPPVVEDGETFEENAYKKASFVSRVLGLPALADDSGLLVEALDGAPGVYSARYAGDDAGDTQRCAKLLAEMKGKTNRRAAFECVLSIAVPTGPALTYEARCEGLILEINFRSACRKKRIRLRSAFLLSTIKKNICRTDPGAKEPGKPPRQGVTGI